MPWPARSPDLNPFEHIWNIIDQKLIGQKLVKMAEIELAIAKEWNAVDPSICTNLIESMPWRIGLCFEARAGHFLYKIYENLKFNIYRSNFIFLLSILDSL